MSPCEWHTTIINRKERKKTTSLKKQQNRRQCIGVVNLGKTNVNNSHVVCGQLFWYERAAVTTAWAAAAAVGVAVFGVFVGFIIVVFCIVQYEMCL